MKTAIIYLGQDPAYNGLAMVELNYIRKFSAHVVERGPNYVVLDRTAFYAEGGGQPFDTGNMEWKGGSTRVLDVVKEGGEVRHHVREIPPIDDVRAEVDWDRRHAHMRMHTAQHLLSGLAFQRFGARTTGNQLYVDYRNISPS